MEPRFIVSSEGLEKFGIKPAGLLGEWLNHCAKEASILRGCCDYWS